MSISIVPRRVAALVLAAGLVAPAGYIAAAQASSTPTVKLRGMQFSPRSVSISKGGKVKFQWAGGSHNLVGPGVKVGVQSSGSKTVTFKKKGTFKFVCQVHPNMSMTVKVK